MKNKKHFQKIPPPKFSSPAWLLLGLIDSVPGKLELLNDQLTFTAFNSGTLWSKGLKKLESKLGISHLAHRLEKNQTTPLFKASVAEIQSVHVPFYYFSAGMHLQINGIKYKLSFIQPNNTRLPSKGMAGLSSLSASVRTGKEWKKLLSPK